MLTADVSWPLGRQVQLTKMTASTTIEVVPARIPIARNGFQAIYGILFES